MRILNPLGIDSRNVATGNLVWVDAVNGNDALAARGRMTIPFLTLTAAKNAAQGGDTIMVMPGTYNEKNLLKNLVNWYFFPGAKINYTGAAAGGIFDTTTNGSNGAVTSFVGGYGEFSILASTGSANVLNCDAGASNLSIQGRLMLSNNVAIKVTAGTCQIQVTEDITCNGGDVILANGGTLTVYARDAYTSGGCCLRVQSGAGTVDISARSLATVADHGISVEGGSGSATLRAYEIRSTSPNKYPLYYNSTSGFIVTVLGARLKSGWSNTAANAAYIQPTGTSADYKVKLPNCVLIAGPTATISMVAVAANIHVLLTGAAANYGVTNILSVGTLATDPNIT